MSQTIILKRSAVAGKKPATTDLQLGEVAINTHDGKMYIKTDNGAGTVAITEVGGDPFPSQTGMDGMFLKTDGTDVYWSETGGTSTSITQARHGFNIGNILRYNGTTYTLAKANAEATADVVGVVTDVTDINTFELTMCGIVTFASGVSFTPGAAYFLSDSTAGAFTPTEPTAVGSVSKPLLIATGIKTGYFYNWRGIEITKEITIDDILPDQTGNANSVLMTNGTDAGWQSIASATSTVTVTATNTFVVGQLVKATSTPATPFALAQANNEANANVFGIISAANATAYSVTTFGKVSGLTGLTAGTLYYLSDSTAGALTATEPTAATSFSKPVLIATSSTSGVFYNQRGLIVGLANATATQMLPTMTGQSGKYLTNNGSAASWTSLQGTQGYTGSRGTTGYTGSKGAVGADGADGAQGPIGYTGSKGTTGATGATGYTGSKGAVGADGADGARGPIGYTGSASSDGRSWVNVTDSRYANVTYYNTTRHTISVAAGKPSGVEGFGASVNGTSVYDFGRSSAELS